MMRGEKQVRSFADSMIAKLQRRAHHGDWTSSSLDSLFAALEGEVRELKEALEASTRDLNAIADECADVANYAMMIADSIKPSND